MTKCEICNGTGYEVLFNLRKPCHKCGGVRVISMAKLNVGDVFSFVDEELDKLPSLYRVCITSDHLKKPIDKYRFKVFHIVDDYKGLFWCGNSDCPQPCTYFTLVDVKVKLHDS